MDGHMPAPFDQLIAVILQTAEQETGTVQFIHRNLIERTNLMYSKRKVPVYPGSTFE
jgi:hypothetical protein